MKFLAQRTQSPPHAKHQFLFSPRLRLSLSFKLTPKPKPEGGICVLWTEIFCMTKVEIYFLVKVAGGVRIKQDLAHHKSDKDRKVEGNTAETVPKDAIAEKV